RKSRKLFRVLPVAAVCVGFIFLGVFLTTLLENRPEKEASQVPYKAEVKLDLPAPPPADNSVPQQVPVVDEISKVQQQASEFGPPKGIESIPKVQQQASEFGPPKEIESIPKVQQQASEFGPPKEIESIPESQGNPLLEKQIPGVEPAEKIADVPQRGPLLTMAPSNLPKEKGASARTVIKGDNVSRILVETYGYYNPDLMKLFKDINPQVKDVNIIMIGEQLKLPQLASPKSRTR
ncbi:MAG: hypothetical protein ACLP51_03780, partial [Syntrophobacteraceae bacterium]